MSGIFTFECYSKALLTGSREALRLRCSSWIAATAAATSAAAAAELAASCTVLEELDDRPAVLDIDAVIFGSSDFALKAILPLSILTGAESSIRTRPNHALL